VGGAGKGERYEGRAGQETVIKACMGFAVRKFEKPKLIPSAEKHLTGAFKTSVRAPLHP
jgi:hypothetical protein